MSSKYCLGNINIYWSAHLGCLFWIEAFFQERVFLLRSLYTSHIIQRNHFAFPACRRMDFLLAMCAFVTA